MKKLIKISMFAGLVAAFSVNAEDLTLVDYLMGEEVSFLIINTGPNAKLTTFGWVAAEEGCKNIKKAGYNVSNVRNWTADTMEETTAACKI